jgi:RNA polymerase sigma factor (sigma-70 family)
MPEDFIVEVLEQLRSGEPHEAWTQFLQEYSALIFRVVRHFEHDADHAADCFQFVCESLSEKNFRRLRQFNVDGPAKFSTWLRAVLRNLCLDWHRKKFGRPRAFNSISRLSVFDQEVFRCLYERGVPFDDACLQLRPRFPELTVVQLEESVDRIETTLTSRQRWLLRARAVQKPASTFDHPEGLPPAIPDTRPDPEVQAILAERRAALAKALRGLSKRQRLLVRLRFEQDLTLDQIATLLDLGNAQRADRQIKDVLARLHDTLKW